MRYQIVSDEAEMERTEVNLTRLSAMYEELEIRYQADMMRANEATNDWRSRALMAELENAELTVTLQRLQAQVCRRADECFDFDAKGMPNIYRADD